MNSQDSNLPLYFTYWGKADNASSDYHILPFHCLDVAAVGYALLRRHRKLCYMLAKLSGMDESTFQRWAVFYLALHDLGKFAESFQNLRPDIHLALQNKISKKTYTLRHDSLGYMLWKKYIRQHLQDSNIIPRIPGSARRQNVPTGFDIWAMAVTGHHGTPPKEQGVFSDHFFEYDSTAACEFVTDIVPLFLNNGDDLQQPDFKLSQMCSWWIAGFSVLCDWVGSNRDYFPFNQNVNISLEKYWELTIEKAERAIAKTELLPAEAAKLSTINSLFYPYLTNPTPLQHCVEEVPISQGPQLFILEDITGAGKTEAAVMLVHRLMAKNSATGVYFGLPTMATANAMYERMSSVYKRLFSEEGAAPSLVLAHGARDLSKTFRQTIDSANDSDQNYGDDTEVAEGHCSAWLADNRKKALLAEIGVGTIDQALLSILPSRHQSMRLLGLMGKVLIVDEVHACDAYMHTLLQALLRAHAIAGGSVILLSATLPASQRRDLISAFNAGIGLPPLTLDDIEKNKYPLLTHSNSNGKTETSLKSRASVCRAVKVSFVHNTDEVEGLIGKALSQNRCVCWIRNTVNDARTAYITLKSRHSDWNIDLFHARYAMDDRLKIETRIVERFGKESTPDQRKGQLLIATQVVEQSLDLDFDVMVTDLAPIDLIIQRAGRLHRHSRDINGQIIEENDQRGTPILIINGPDPMQSVTKYWYSAYFKGASAVYENHGQLWLTAKLLKDKKEFHMPEDARDLIEGVYSENPAYQIPDELWENTFNAEGEEKAKSGMAELNALKLDNGYTGMYENQWWDDALTPTRLGDTTITVYLARWDGNSMSPWVGNVEHAWPKSAIQIRQQIITAEAADENVTQEVINSYRNQLPAKGKWGVLLPLTCVKNDIWKGKATNKDSQVVNIYYSPEVGLLQEKEVGQLI